MLNLSGLKKCSQHPAGLVYRNITD